MSIDDLKNRLDKIKADNRKTKQPISPIEELQSIELELPENPRSKTETPASWKDQMIRKAILEARKLVESEQQQISLTKYQDDPVGFGLNILKTKMYTDDVIRVMISVRDNPVTIAKSSNSTGKSQPIFTPVLTPGGYRLIGDITIGDYVIGSDGYPSKVIGVYPQGEQPTYRITFSDGSSTLCSRDHLWNIRSSNDKSKGNGWKTKPTEWLIDHIDSTLHIPICNSVQFTTKNFDVDPYVLGILIGNGYLRAFSAIFNSSDEYIVDEVKNRVAPFSVRFVHKNRNDSFRIFDRYGFGNRFVGFLRKLGLMGLGANKKYIPESYMFGDVEQRKLLLAGLVDTDGTIDSKHCISYTTVSERLAKQVVWLVNSLGGVATICTKNSQFSYKGEKRNGQLAYNVYITVPFCPFRLQRKINRWRDPANTSRNIFRTIRSIEYIGEIDSVCIRVDNKDQLYLTENFIVTHNSHSAAHIALWWFSVFRESKVYLTAAPPVDNLRRIVFAGIENAIRSRKELFNWCLIQDLLVKDPKNKEHFINGISIPTTGTREERIAKFSGKHSPHLLFIVDEGDGVPDEVYEAIDTCMTGGIARLLIMYNPKVKSGIVYNKDRDRKGKVIRLCALDHPNVKTGENIIPGAVTRDVVIRRFNDMTRTLGPNEEEGIDCIDTPEFLVGETTKALDGSQYPPLAPGKRKVLDAAFWYSILGEYPPQGEMQLISDEWLDKAVNRWIEYRRIHGNKPPNVRPIVGVDVAEYGGDANALCSRYGSYVEAIKTWRGVDVDFSTNKVIYPYVEDHNPDFVMVDATGLGSSVAPALHRLMRAKRNMGEWMEDDDKIPRPVAVKVGGGPSPMIEDELAKFRYLRDQLWWATRVYLKDDPNAMIPDDPELIEELRAPSYHKTLQGNIAVTPKDDIRDKLKRSPNKADALCLTFYPMRRVKSIKVGDSNG